MDTLKSEGESSGGDAATFTPNLQGTIFLTQDNGSLTSWQVGGSPATVDFVQGATPVQSAQFGLGRRARIPMPPPSSVTTLEPGENNIPIIGSWDNASLSWTFAGSAGAGAATFSLNMPGLPTGPTGWALVSDIAAPGDPSQPIKADFQIACSPVAIPWLLSFSIMSPMPSNMFNKPMTLVYVDGVYVGSFSDGDNVVLNGKVVSLTVMVSFQTPSDTVQIQYTLQTQW